MFGRLDSVIFKETSVLVAALRKKADFLSVFSDVGLACTLRKQGAASRSCLYEASHRPESEGNNCFAGCAVDIC